MEACRAGAWPKLAESTLPINTSLTASMGSPDLAKAPLMAMAPNWVAGTVEREPLKLPIGVLAAATI